MPAFPKPRPRALEKADRRKAIDATDKAENAKVKARSGGQCEMRVWLLTFPKTRSQPACKVLGLCERRAIHIHHLLGGIGVRGRGESALAKNKLHLCAKCHSDIHAHILQPRGNVWERVR